MDWFADVDDKGPPRPVTKRPSGTFRIVQEHARRAAEILSRCDHEHGSGRRCVRDRGHELPHRDFDRYEWNER
jgi:hypothetical protein